MPASARYGCRRAMPNMVEHSGKYAREGDSGQCDFRHVQGLSPDMAPRARCGRVVTVPSHPWGQTQLLRARPDRPWSVSGGDGGDRRAVDVRLDRLEREDALQRTDAARAELRACGPTKLAEGLGSRARRAVDPRRQHRVERVGDVDD